MSQSKPPFGNDDPGLDGENSAQEDDPVARAEAVVAAFADEYLNWLGDDLDRIDKMLDSARSSPGMVEQLRRKAHDIRGQGGSFGFPLITSLADALHKVVTTQQGGLTDHGTALIREAVSAMRLVVEHRAKGSGDVATRAAVDAVMRNVEATGGGL